MFMLVVYNLLMKSVMYLRVRFAVRAFVATLFAVIIGVVGSLDFADATMRSPIPAPTTAGTTTADPNACPPPLDKKPRVRSKQHATPTVKQWNTIFSQPTVTRTWLGGDVNLSISADGDIWWLYGDTLMRSGSEHELLTSTALYVARGTHTPRNVSYRDENGVDTPTLLPSTLTEKYWPSSVIPHPTERNRYLLAASRINTYGVGMWDFQLVGSTVFDISLTPGDNPTITRHGAYRTPQPTPHTAPIQWGSAMVAEGNSIYLYGTQEVLGSVGKDVYLARAPIPTIRDTTTWTFLSADPHTTPNVNNAKPIIDASNGLPHTFSVIPHPEQDGFLMVAKENEGIGDHVVAAAGLSPAGPWDTFTPIINTPPRGNIWSYMAIAHPDLPTRAPGRNKKALLITVSENIVGENSWQTLTQNPDLYRPRFFKVAYRNLPRN